MGCTSSSSILDIRRTVVQSSSTAILWSMADREKIAIKRTWRYLLRNRDTVGTKLFLEIFSRRPALQTMFEFCHVTIDNLPEDSDFRRHVNKVMQTIGALVDNIEDLDITMAPVLLQIGRHHCSLLGFDLELCDVFSESLLKVWRQELGKRFRADVGFAWKQLFDFMILKIGEGYLSLLSRGATDD